MTTPRLPSVSFVIPVRDDAARLELCVRSIRECDYPRSLVQIVVLDHGSRDSSAAVALAAGADVVRVDERVPVGALRNLGAARATGELFAFVDADHEIDSQWIRVAASALQDPHVAMAGALCCAPERGTWVQHAYDALRNRSGGSRDVEWLGSGNMIVRRQVFEQAGGFDASLHTCEDVDLCARVRAMGLRLREEPAMRSIHYGDPATLRALFAGELWRGRDNIRVSVRSRMTVRSIPSVAVPVIDLAAFAALVASPFASAPLLCAGAALATLGGFAALRAARMVHRSPQVRLRQGFGGTSPKRAGRARRRAGMEEAARAFTVACVYDVARALARVMRAPHRTRRSAAAPGGLAWQ